MFSQISSRWLSVALILGGVHSVVWGCFIILLPYAAAAAYGLAEPPHDLFLWQGTGLVILLFGTGYLIAALNPLQHWVAVLIALLAKVLGPAGLLVAVLRGEVSADVLWLLPVNDLIWWGPFTIVVIKGMRNAETS